MSKWCGDENCLQCADKEPDLYVHLPRADYDALREQNRVLAEAVPMSEAGWTSEKPTEAGWYWNRISGAVGIALITRRDGRLYAWLKFKDAWLTREGWLDYIHGEWLGPITPDSYVRGRVEGRKGDTWIKKRELP